MILTAYPRRRITGIPMLAAAGTVIFVFESIIPTPLPWAKLGLSNIAVLLALVFWGFPEALAVSWLRIVVGGLFTGTLLSPAFAFGICGGLIAASVMWLLYKFCRRQFSPIGISISGAAAHSVGQIIAAKILFIRHPGIWHLLPFMIIISVFTGALVGFIAYYILARLSFTDK